MKEVRKFYVSPNQPNLCISVVKCKREDMFNHLEWLVDVIKKKGTNTPKTIIVCNGTLTDIGALFSYLLLRLGGAAYSPDDSQASDQRVIGIYHSLTLKKSTTHSHRTRELARRLSCTWSPVQTQVVIVSLE